MNSPAPTSRVSASPAALHLYLYRRPLHPELFQLKGRKSLSTSGYELEAWVMPGAHLLRFRVGTFTCCELVVAGDTKLPLEGAVTGFPCTGEHEFAHSFAERVHYSTSVQAETLSDNLYRNTYDDMLEYPKQADVLVHTYTDQNGGKCLSLLDLQKLPREVHCQGFHLLAGSGLVLRTQTIFGHKAGS